MPQRRHRRTVKRRRTTQRRRRNLSRTRRGRRVMRGGLGNNDPQPIKNKKQDSNSNNNPSNLSNNANNLPGENKADFQFCVDLRGPDHEAFPASMQGMTLAQMAQANLQRIRSAVHTPDVAKKVVEWYTDILADNEAFKSIRHIHGSVYEIKCDPDADDQVEMMADPDDDGNYPLEIDGVEYMVTGYAHCLEEE